MEQYMVPQGEGDDASLSDSDISIPEYILGSYFPVYPYDHGKGMS